jgi:Type II restriction endonuclease EcoO109I
MIKMTPLNLQDVTAFVEQNIGDFHKQRLDKVADIKLKKVLLTKNPYLFRAKHVTNPSEIVQGILSAYISSSEEGIFGNWLERLAIFINDSVYHGRKAAVEGMDLDFDREDKRYLVNIKSGPNWANGGQTKHMMLNLILPVSGWQPREM